MAGAVMVVENAIVAQTGQEQTAKLIIQLAMQGHISPLILTVVRVLMRNRFPFLLMLEIKTVSFLGAYMLI